MLFGLPFACLCTKGESMRTRMQLGFMVLLTALFTLNRHRFISGLLGLSLVLAIVPRAACGEGATLKQQTKIATFGLTVNDHPLPAGVTVLSWFS